MGSDDTSQQFQDLQAAAGQDRLLRALTYELKQPLIRIARQAEAADTAALAAIQQTAEQTLRLIDSYLLTAQTEYGQLSLDLSPVSTGAIMYETLQSMESQMAGQNISLVIDNRAQEPVMTHKPALSAILQVFGRTLLDLQKVNRLSSSAQPEVILRSYKTRRGAVGIGMFSTAPLVQSDVSQALELLGKAHLPLGRAGSSAHVSLAIADGLCRAIGGALYVKHMGKLNGLVTELPRSEQLSLV